MLKAFALQCRRIIFFSYAFVANFYHIVFDNQLLGTRFARWARCSVWICRIQIIAYIVVHANMCYFENKLFKDFALASNCVTFSQQGECWYHR